MSIELEYVGSIISIEGGEVMEAQERVRILEFAWELVKDKKPQGNLITEASITAWHKLFDKAYTAILDTTLKK